MEEIKPREEQKPQRPKKLRILQEEYNALKEKASLAESYLDSLKRLQAEFENARKRIEKERQEFLKFSNEGLMRTILPLIDSFQHALTTFSANGNEDAHFDGIKLIYKQMSDLLSQEGLSKIKTVGERFDPNMHEAVIDVESNEHPEGTILEELRSGYMYHDKCLRPAIVKVAKNSAQEV